MIGSRSAYTRARILQAAERLFAHKGHENTSLREITAEAQVNLSSVNYHFGSKEGLIQALHQQQLDALEQERLDSLDRLEKRTADGPIEPVQIVEAFFRPLLQHALRRSGGGPYAAPAERPLADPNSFLRALVVSDHTSATARFLAALDTALPHVPKHEILWRFQFMLGATSGAVMGMDGLLFALNRESAEAPDLNRLCQRLTVFLTGGLLAPLPTGETPTETPQRDTPDETDHHCAGIPER